MTVGMPVYNGERFIREALDSILAQTYTDFELVISDNASTDSTADICRDYASRDGRIRYIRHDRNRGILENTAFVMTAATGTYFMLVGDDDVYDPMYLETMVGLLAESAHVALAYSNYSYITETGARLNPVGLTMAAKPTDSEFRNFGRFIFYRSCLPMMMGLFRREVLLKALPMPYGAFAPVTGDVDNVFLANVMTRGKLSSTERVLFFYRLKDRSSSFPNDWPNGFWRQSLYMFRHHAKVSDHLAGIVRRSALPRWQKVILVCWNWCIFVVCYGLYTWGRVKSLRQVNAQSASSPPIEMG